MSKKNTPAVENNTDTAVEPVKTGYTAPEIVMLPVADIKPYWRNPRQNNSTIPALVKSIERFGFNVPLVVDKDKIIVTGHARFKAVRRMGMVEVPCIISHLSTTKHREFRVLDNRIAEESRWDEDVLQGELKAMFDGTDLAEFFDGTLDLVIDVDGLTQSAEPLDLTDDVSEDDVESGESEDDGAAEDWYAGKCPFCGTHVRKEHIIG